MHKKTLKHPSVTEGVVLAAAASTAMASALAITMATAAVMIIFHFRIARGYMRPLENAARGRGLPLKRHQHH